MVGVGPLRFYQIRSGLADGEISKFIGGESTSTTTTRNNPRRCYRTSTSSGYSSHSSPLSAGSYSYYASASTSTKDPSYGGSLAVIHESETIPRPIWPSVIYHHIKDCNVDYEGIYTCHICDCTYSYSPLSPPPPSPPPPRPLQTSSPFKTSTREILLELSRTLNSVINGDITITPENILRDISRIVSLEIASKNDNVYEYVCPSWTFNDKNLSVLSSYVPSKVNPVNSKLYVGPRCLYDHNSTRFVPLLKSRIMRREEDGETKKNFSLMKKKLCGTSDQNALEYLNGKHIGSKCAKLSFGLDADSKRCRNGLSSAKPKYSMQLKCSDVGSSNERTIIPLSTNNWNHRLAVRSLGEDFDFTLDVTRAERLGRTIARAKRKRQWCRVLTILFGLVFFVLSVVVVSLSVTRGRKIFGSM